MKNSAIGAGLGGQQGGQSIQNGQISTTSWWAIVGRR